MIALGLIVFLYILWTIGPTWDFTKLLPTRKGKTYGKINKNY